MAGKARSRQSRSGQRSRERRSSIRCCASAPAFRSALVQSWEEIVGPRLAATRGRKRSSGRAACMRTIRSSRRCWSSPARAWRRCISSTRPARSSAASTPFSALARSAASGSCRSRSHADSAARTASRDRLTGAEKAASGADGRRHRGRGPARLAGAAGRDRSGPAGKPETSAASRGFVIAMTQIVAIGIVGQPCLNSRQLSLSGHSALQYPTSLR